MNYRTSRCPLGIITAILFLTLSANSRGSSVDALNYHAQRCYASTQQHKEGAEAIKPSVRHCNAVIKSAIANRENRGIAFHNRGVIQLQMGQRDSALRSFKMALRYQPDNRKTLLAVSAIHQQNDRFALTSPAQELGIAENAPMQSQD